MSRNRTRTTCQRCDGERGCIPGWIADSEDRVNAGGFDKHDTDDLRIACGTPRNGIRKIFAIQRQKKLTRLVGCNLKAAGGCLVIWF